MLTGKQIAITCQVSPGLSQCQLEFLEREAIDLLKARAQHSAYIARLPARALVISLPASAEFPDSAFVEDTAVVLDEVAILTRLGTPARQGEEARVADVLAEFRELRRVGAPATIEGGDVLRIGRTLYVGQSRRTNAEGFRQLRGIAEEFGYRAVPVPVDGCLHLKTACSYIGEERVLVNRAWIDAAPLSGLRLVDVPVAEPWGANVLLAGEEILTPASAPKTHELLLGLGCLVESIDISELQKAEAGLTCLSLLFSSL
jgi:dimethylargininase